MQGPQKKEKRKKKGEQFFLIKMGWPDSSRAVGD
jgi:hypothetical protein